MRRIIFAAAAPLLLSFPSVAAGAPPGWRISEATGEVRLVENGRSRAATRGALLSSGSVIATGANARAVIVRGKEFVVVSPRSQVRVPEPVFAGAREHFERDACPRIRGQPEAAGRQHRSRTDGRRLPRVF